MTQLQEIRKKIVSVAEFVQKKADFPQKKVVFTNGCFDILHFGHVCYLSAAKDLGDLLVVGLNSDASVQRLKGPARPINDGTARATVLAALQVVDFVIFFEEDTPEQLIEAVAPDVLVKGSDYQISDIVGADFVLKRGGEVKTIAFVDGFSTTGISEKLKN